MRLNKLTAILFIMILGVLLTQHIFLMKQSHNTISSIISDGTEVSNLTTTKLFVNGVYPNLADIIQLEKNTSPTSGLKGAELTTVDTTIRTFMLGTDILKIKLFALNGMTIYSTELNQIGDDKAKYDAFISASQGKLVSQISHRGKFNSLDGEVFDKDVVSSYLPIRNKFGSVIGVTEIYTDRTPSILEANKKEGNTYAFLLLFEVLTMVFVIFIIWSMLTVKADENDDTQLG